MKPGKTNLITISDHEKHLTGLMRGQRSALNPISHAADIQALLEGMLHRYGIEQMGLSFARACANYSK